MNTIKLSYKYDDEHQDTAEVWIDGIVDGTPQRFILDTGCATTCLFYNDFSAKYTSFGAKQYSSAFGSATSESIKVAQIGSGPIQRKDILIARTEKGGNDKNLIGMDLLKDSILHLMPSQQKVEILTSSSMNTQVQDLFLDSGSIPFIELDFGEQKAVAVWDTGASITIVDLNFFKQYRELFHSGGKTTGTDSAGHTFETEIYMMKPIKIGEHLFPTHRVVPLDLNHLGPKTGRGMDFILGYSTIRYANWLMDFPGRKWFIAKTLF
ncbi:MAG: retropepsin-like aspartic protease [Bdellovibrionia bacterium]